MDKQMKKDLKALTKDFKNLGKESKQAADNLQRIKEENALSGR